MPRNVVIFDKEELDKIEELIENMDSDIYEIESTYRRVLMMGYSNRLKQLLGLEVDIYKFMYPRV